MHFDNYELFLMFLPIIIKLQYYLNQYVALFHKFQLLHDNFTSSFIVYSPYKLVPMYCFYQILILIHTC